MLMGLLALRKRSPSSRVSGSFFLFVSGSRIDWRPTWDKSATDCECNVEEDNILSI